MLHKLLIIDSKSNKDFTDYLRKQLNKFKSFNVFKISNLFRYTSEIEDANPDLILLDWDLEKLDAKSICEDIQQKFPKIPIIAMGKDENSDKPATSLKSGAIDFITKPIDIEELRLRVDLRVNSKQDTEENLKLGHLKVDEKSKKIYIKDNILDLTKREYNLLVFLIKNSNKVVDRKTILDKVWKEKDYVSKRIVDVYIGYLRDKLNEADSDVKVKTERGFGYTLQIKN